jgi:hypothetical protein
MSNNGTVVKANGITKSLEGYWQDTRVQAALQVIFLIIMGVMAAFLKKLSPGIGVSGSSAVLWLSPMIVARLFVRRDGAGSLTGAAVALWGIPIGINNGLAHNLALYAGTGLAIDVMARLPFLNLRNPVGAIICGIVAHLVKFGFILGSALASSATKNFIISGVAKSFFLHIVFGAAAGFAAWGIYKGWHVIKNRRNKQQSEESRA